MIKITIKPENPEDLSRHPEHTMSFKNSASLKSEIFPTVFKSRELATGSCVWVDSKRLCRRYQDNSILRKLMAPIRISNTGFSETVSSMIESLILKNRLTVVNSIGERFVLSYAKEANSSDSDDQRNEIETNKESSRTVSVTPVPLSMPVKNKQSLFASVEGYVPSKVNRDL